MFDPKYGPEPSVGYELCYECLGTGHCIVCDGSGLHRGNRCSGCHGSGNCIVCQGRGDLFAGTYRGLIEAGRMQPMGNLPPLVDLPPLPRTIERAALSVVFEEVIAFLHAHPGWSTAANAEMRFCTTFKRPGFGEVEFCMVLAPSPRGGGVTYRFARGTDISQYASGMGDEANFIQQLRDMDGRLDKLIPYLMAIPLPTIKPGELWYDGSLDIR